MTIGVNLRERNYKMKDETIRYYDECDEKEIKDLLMYRKVEKISEDELQLDNGMVLKIQANEGCGGCSAGWYSITELNGCENAITNVELVCDGDVKDKEYYETSYKIFVLAADKRIKLLQVDGDDGSGYYGTGYLITVKVPKNLTT
jgi:hypothetical protein